MKRLWSRIVRFFLWTIEVESLIMCRHKWKIVCCEPHGEKYRYVTVVKCWKCGVRGEYQS